MDNDLKSEFMQRRHCKVRVNDPIKQALWTLDGPRVKSEIGRRKAEKQALSTYLDPNSDFRFPTSDFKWGTSKVQKY